MLARRRHGEDAQSARIDLVAAVGIQHRLDDARNGKALIDQPLGDPETRRDLAHIQSLGLEGGECLVLVDLVHRKAGDVFGQRGLDGFGVVAVLHDGDRHRLGIAFLGQFCQRRVAPLSGDDLEALAVGLHQ